jgi:hypothetical protein
MFININPWFSQIKSYVCFTILQTVNQNYPVYPFIVQITKGIRINQIIRCIHKSQKISNFN